MLQQRRLAVSLALEQQRLASSLERGPFPIDLILMLAGTLQVLNTLLIFISSGGNIHLDSTHAALMAEYMFKRWSLPESLFSVSSFLLRCVRQHQVQQHSQAPKLYPSFEQVRLAACQNICYVSVQMFPAIYLHTEPLAEAVLRKVPPRFFDTLGCLACEGLPSHDKAASLLANLLLNSGMSDVSCNITSPMMYCPSMQQLSRRTAPSAFFRGKDVQVVLETLKAYHPELARDCLLSPHISRSLDWDEDIYPSSLSLDHAGMWPSLGVGGGDETCDAYFQPCVRDLSLQALRTMLPMLSSAAVDVQGGNLGATKSRIYATRIAAVLLSLSTRGQPLATLAPGTCGGVNAVDGSASLIAVLATAARFSSAMATQLLQALRMGHAKCECVLYQADDFMDQELRRPDLVVDCEPCYALAEGITALLLQIMRLFKAHIEAVAGDDDLDIAFGELN